MKNQRKKKRSGSWKAVSVGTNERCIWTPYRLDSTGTLLANRRTLLSYIQTSLALVVSGLSLVNFFRSNPIFLYFGWGLIPVGLFTLGAGFVHHSRIKKYVLNELRKEPK